jgi:putative methyltransferase (TIGR04325 family)
MSDQHANPTNPRRLGYKALEILLGRLPTGRWARALPGLSRFYADRVMARRDHTGLYSGIYPSYASAMADVPAARQAGWNHENSAKLWVDQVDPVRLSTYPIFFWLTQLYGAHDALVDVGGSIGLTYYGYRRLGQLPAGATWNVVEVTKIAEQGARIAQRENAAGLSFVDRLEAVGRCDILISAGALQFMETSLPGLLESLSQKPRFILLNKLPITAGEDCWTLQNYGPAVTPNRLFNEQAFLRYFEGHGYQLRDRWAVQDLDCIIPFHPERFIKEFAGFVFERR